MHPRPAQLPDCGTADRGSPLAAPRPTLVAAALLAMLLASLLPNACGSAGAEEAVPDGTVTRKRIRSAEGAENLLAEDAWRPWQAGFDPGAEGFVCDNGDDRAAQRGASQTVVLNQRQAEPIVASAWSRAEGVGGAPDSDYALYLDLVYADGTPLWGQVAPFATGSHDWQRRQVIVVPEKPVRQLSFHLLLRRHTGKAWFRDAELRVVHAPEGCCLFEGAAVSIERPARRGFHVRDVAADSDFVSIDREALGLKLQWSRERVGETDWIDATVEDGTGRDRAITLVYTLPVPSGERTWFQDPRRSEAIEPGRTYRNAGTFRAGTGSLSRYPLAAVGAGDRGLALGIDMAHPAFFRAAFHSGTGELLLACDLGLTPEKPAARLRFCAFPFDASRGFRGAWAQYMQLFPEAFRCRVPEQGIWMPFARISEVEGWQDFGFRFKEGDNETAWDDAHGILTFRYTEPMTWWMSMPANLPRTREAAEAEARRRAAAGDRSAQALLTSGYHDDQGRWPARLLDTPWCNGAVWSVNSLPGIAGEATDFGNKWNPQLRERLYGGQAAARLDGEYIDSSEGYVTDELDFCRAHFAAAQTPLTFSPDSLQPAIFRGLIAFEYVRAIADDMHASGRLMMANATPSRICWLAPLLDVLGTETDWNPEGRWQPMGDAELLYRRALCGAKPFCFLMNTDFDRLPADRVERYIKRSAAYGMFPGFFSPNASQGHYFSRPELYRRDRPLFRRYVPLCRLLAEAGWQPLTGAVSSDPAVYVERFGARYLTVFNEASEPRAVAIRLEHAGPRHARELVSGRTIPCEAGILSLSLDGEDLAVLDFGDAVPTR